MKDKEVLFKVRSLRKRFPNGFEAISNLDLDIYKGECLLMAGSNGSGKTLLMRMLAGLQEPTEGSIFFKGIALPQCTGLLRRSLGIVFQDADSQIVGETVEEDIRFGPENLKLGKDEIGRRVEDALEMLEMKTKRDFPPRRLSGGEKRRLAVAGVIAMGCDTIIMDEPFANLDMIGVVQVIKIIKDLKQAGRTAIILTHELEKVLALADRLVILDKGRIRADGKPEEVLDSLDPGWGVRDPRMGWEAFAHD
ncbi:energy-coupling factor ABC transporter ATP-binding protein [Leadbettera azotonutricia]|uniref:Cobalt import ATP-binding protein CbiO 2 n=1 Tax=Leadbettera azotonutricia (strain ATCC BAA-888 / DSM 13862 / ZAS-9) TaxID=545695 RepID=F5YCT1_LEAAZ|nr:ABC transporter ATP-binding protein [Leadbettera azotonutricia]AEF83170.1 cobalt import ATP-binding protein CbiO 2 [Leadbettera azotonutricia ZAS-9]